MKSSGIVAALYWCSAGLLLLTIFAVFDRGGAAVLIIGVFGSAALLGIAKLIECANETAQRVVRMEIHLETLANDRK